MNWFDRLFGDRKKHLESPQSERAFAPDPASDVWQLASGGDNQSAFAHIREHGVTLWSVATGESVSLADLAPVTLLFATMWEPYSAKTIGAMKNAVDSDEVASFAIVFFENSRDEVISNKRSSWYFPHTYVLDRASISLRTLIGRVPFRVTLGPGGQVESITEGKA